MKPSPFVFVLCALAASACGAAASPTTLDRLRGYGFVGAGGETLEELESRSRSSHLAASDESPAPVVEADGLLRALLPLLLDRVADPRATTLAARLRGLPACRTWDDVARVEESLGPALEVWEADLPVGELARFATDANVARAAAPISARTALVVSIHSVTHFIAAFHGTADVGAADDATSRAQALCPSEIADLAIAVGSPVERVRDVVHSVVRDVRVADTSPATAEHRAPCVPPSAASGG